MDNNNASRRLSIGTKIKYALATVSLLAIFIISVSETALYFTHYNSIYSKVNEFSVVQAKWWVCDSLKGPRYLPGKVDRNDSIYFKDNIWYYDRLNLVNNEGYHDRDDFMKIPDDSNALRFLIAGDSFTWGASADFDSSYVEIFERNIKKSYPAVVWNTGIPATGTNHAIFTTRKYLPLQKSDFVILGFYTGNDFGDNLLPFDKLIFTDQASCYNLYTYDKTFKPFPISTNEAFKKATGSYPLSELSIPQKFLIRSRFYSFLSEMVSRVANRLSGDKKRNSEQEYIATKEYLKQLDQYIKDSNAKLIVFVIPSWVDLQSKDPHYSNVVKILNELSINYLETINLYSPSDYLKTGGDHWNNKGHLKAGNALSNCLITEIVKKREDNTKRSMHDSAH